MSKPKRVLSAEDKETLIWWNVWRADPKRPLEWARSLKRSIDALTTTPTPEVAAIFWIRLHGIICEMLEAHEPSPPEPSSSEPSSTELDALEQQAAAVDELYADIAAGVFLACVALRRIFTLDELLVIQWKRDHEAHPELSAYDLAERDGVLVHSRKHKLVGNVMHRDVHEAVQAARKGRDDTELAVEFALRAASHVDAIISALEEFPKL